MVTIYKYLYILITNLISIDETGLYIIIIKNNCRSENIKDVIKLYILIYL